MTARTDSYRQEIYNAPYEICVERAKYYTESYKETEGLHPSLRAAKALKKTLENMTIYILDQERLVGNRSSKFIGVIIPIERGEINFVITDDLKNLKKRSFKPYHISAEDERLLVKELFPYWIGKTVREKKVELWKEHGLYWKPNWGLRSWVRRYRQFGWPWLKEFYQRLIKGRLTKLSISNKLLAGNNPNFVNNVFDVQGHLVMGHKNIINWGYGGLQRKIRQRMDELTGDEPQAWLEGQVGAIGLPRKGTDRRPFLEAALICAEAATKFIQRFAKLANEKAVKEEDQARKAELEQISAICERVATEKPQNFREAIQLVWFNQVIATISHGLAGILAIGRPDQYLYPFFKADLEAGSITNEEVIELCEELMIKMSYNLLILPSYGKDTASELGADNAAITIGGVDKEGNDSVNELSYLFMDAIENLKSMTNSFSIRISPSKSSRKWMERTLEVFSKTSGPAVFNDDIIIPALQSDGVSLEDARDYALIGCVEPTSQGNTFGTTSGNDISLVGLLEMVLTDGMIRNAGRRFGIRTGNPKKFTTYEEIWNAFLQHLEFTVESMVKRVDIKDKIYAELYPNPFISMTLDGCLEKALDMTQGGAKYNFSSISGRGLATLTDSLCALKKVVFEDKTLTMKEMLKILNSNFKKKEEFQSMLKNKLPKFGNDDDYVDSIARDVADAFCDEVRKYTCLRTPGRYRASFFSYGMFLVDGFLLGATPDGRNAGQAVSNSLSPSNNAERNGPTAVIKSLAKLDHKKISNGLALNMRFLPALLQSPEKRSKLADLFLTYFKLGGMEYQLNILNQKDLLDAQVHPENYKDLVVRVSGYSAYFIDVGKPVQDDIIARCEFKNL